MSTQNDSSSLPIIELFNEFEKKLSRESVRETGREIQSFGKYSEGISFSGGGCQRGHLLDHVISNLEILPDFYEKATLCYTVRETDPLRKVFFASGKDAE